MQTTQLHTHMCVCIIRVNRYILTRISLAYFNPFFSDFPRQHAVVPGHHTTSTASCQPWLETIRLAKATAQLIPSTTVHGKETENHRLKLWLCFLGDICYLSSRPLNRKQKPKCGLKWLRGFNKIYWIPQLILLIQTYRNEKWFRFMALIYFLLNLRTKVTSNQGLP